MICPYLKSCLFRHYFWNFRLPLFEKVIHNESFLFRQTELIACFLSRNAPEQNLFPRNGISSCFFFHQMVRKRIPRVCFLFCSTVGNSEHFSLKGNGSEWNPESLLFRGTNRSFVGTNHLFSLFRLLFSFHPFHSGQCRIFGDQRYTGLTLILKRTDAGLTNGEKMPVPDKFFLGIVAFRHLLICEHKQPPIVKFKFVNWNRCAHSFKAFFLNFTYVCQKKPAYFHPEKKRPVPEPVRY